ncbi:MAG: hypothetical protein LPH21_09365, partial [Shewanella sp.]|nr:hypothetical protein [Shewanella sp.]
TRRIIRRMGKPVVMVTGNGVRLEPEPLGVFSNPEGDRLHKGRAGELVFKARQPTLLVLTDDVRGLDKDWRIVINGTEYFAADHNDDGNGGTAITLAPAATVGAGEQDDGKGNWR